MPPVRYDQRFKPKADAEQVEQLAQLPPGATVTVRAVTFRKAKRNSWANDFRTGLTDREVASTFDGSERISA